MVLFLKSSDSLLTFIFSVSAFQRASVISAFQDFTVSAFSFGFGFQYFSFSAYQYFYFQFQLFSFSAFQLFFPATLRAGQFAGAVPSGPRSTSTSKRLRVESGRLRVLNSQ